MLQRELTWVPGWWCCSLVPSSRGPHWRQARCRSGQVAKTAAPELVCSVGDKNEPGGGGRSCELLRQDRREEQGHPSRAAGALLCNRNWRGACCWRGTHDLLGACHVTRSLCDTGAPLGAKSALYRIFPVETPGPTGQGGSCGPPGPGQASPGSPKQHGVPLCPSEGMWPWLGSQFVFGALEVREPCPWDFCPPSG